jgi:hypothetical protein
MYLLSMASVVWFSVALYRWFKSRGALGVDIRITEKIAQQKSN